MDKEPTNLGTQTAEQRKSLLSLLPPGGGIQFLSKDKKFRIVSYVGGYMCMAYDSGAAFNLTSNGEIVRVELNKPLQHLAKDVVKTSDPENIATISHILDQAFIKYKPEIESTFVPATLLQSTQTKEKALAEIDDPEKQSNNWRKNLLSLIPEPDSDSFQTTFKSKDDQVSISNHGTEFRCDFTVGTTFFIFNLSKNGSINLIWQKEKDNSKFYTEDSKSINKKAYLLNTVLAKYEKEIKERYIPQPSKSDKTQKTVEEKVLESLEKPNEDDEPMAWSKDT